MTLTPVSRARLAVITVFLINGFTLATWVANIPLMKAKLGLSEGVLGLTLLSMAAGGLVAMPLAGVLIPRFGSKNVTRLTILTFILLPVLPLTAASLPLLVVFLFLFGAFQGASDVAMNAQAIAVEDAINKPIMSSFHGFWSVGSLAGAGLGILFISLSVSPALHALVVTATGGIAMFFALRFLLDAGDEQADHNFVLPTGPLLLLGALAFFALVGEGSIADWSAVYLHDVLGTSQAFAVVGFAAFSLTMAVGRFVGDAVNTRFGAVSLLRSSALLSSLGLALALLIPNPVTALLGFAAMGFGIANLIPLLFSAAGRVPGVNPGTGIAAVTTAGYFGFLAGPPLIGLTAEIISLRGALFIVVVLVAVIAVFAHTIKPRARTPDTAVPK